MNYAREVKEFNRQAKMRGIVPSDRTLWMVLFEYSFEGNGKPFEVLTSRLASDTMLTERTIINARERLQAEGFITFEAADKGKPCTYTVTILAEEAHGERTNDVIVSEVENENSANPAEGRKDIGKKIEYFSDLPSDEVSSPFSSPLVSPLPFSPTPPLSNPPIIPPTQPPVVVADAPTDIVKPVDKQADAFVGSTDQPDNNDYDDGGEFGLTSDEIEQHRRLVSELEAKAKDYGLPWHIGDINRTVDWCGEYSPEWVLLAIDRASMRERRSWGLVKGILKSWQSRGAPDGLVPSGGVDDRPPVISD